MTTQRHKVEDKLVRLYQRWNKTILERHQLCYSLQKEKDLELEAIAHEIKLAQRELAALPTGLQLQMVG